MNALNILLQTVLAGKYSGNKSQPSNTPKTIDMTEVVKNTWVKKDAEDHGQPESLN